jgi:hypothetical protein
VGRILDSTLMRRAALNVVSSSSGASVASGGFSFVQTATASTGGSTTVPLTVAAVGAAHLLVITIKTANAPGTVTVTDNSGGGHTYATTFTTTSGSFGLYQIYGVNVTPGATLVTITFANPIAARVSVDEYAGNLATTASVFDIYQSSIGSGTSASTVSFSPAAAGELIAASFATGSAKTITAGTNYAVASNGVTTPTAYRLSSSTSETAPISWTGVDTWAEIAAAFKPILPFVVQAAQGSGTSKAISAAVANNLLVVFVNQSSTTAAPTITDSAGGSYTLVPINSVYATSTASLYVGYKIATGGETSVSATPGSGGSVVGVSAFEVYGAATPTVETSSKLDNGAFASASTTAAITTSNNDIILSAVAITAAQTAPVWSGSVALTTVSAGGSHIFGGYTYTGALTAQQFTCTWTGSRNNGNLVIALRSFL